MDYGHFLNEVHGEQLFKQYILLVYYSYNYLII